MGKRKNGEGSFSVKTINGIKYQYYRDPSGKQFYAKTTKDLKEKIKAWKDIQKENDKLINNSDGTLTIGQFSNEWLKSKQTTIKPKTYDGYEFNINIINDKRFGFGTRQIKTINKDHVQNFLNSLAKSYARNTITKTRTLLNQIFEEAIEKKLITSNPVVKTKVPLEENIEKDTKEIIILQQSDINKLIIEADCINGDGLHKPCGKIGTPRYGMSSKAIIFLLQTGLRAGELIGLTWDNVDLNKKEIHIKKSITLVKDRLNETENNYMMKSGSPKTKKGIRTIPLTNKAIEILEYCEKNKISDYVFSTKNGKPFDISNLERTLNKMLLNAECDIDQCGLHALRHTFASQLLANGVDIQVVSKLLGHSKVSTTYDIYIHLLEDQDEKAIEVLNNAMVGKQ